jgi:hypothetical protein
VAELRAEERIEDDRKSWRVVMLTGEIPAFAVGAREQRNFGRSCGAQAREEPICT